jgi:integrase
MVKITTDASAKAARADGAQSEYADARVAGLALRVTASGKKTWSFRYRTLAGQQRRLTLGQYPAVSLTTARQAAWDTLAVVAKGVDPANDRRRAKADAKARRPKTFGDLGEEYFKAAETGRHRPNGRPKRATTMRMERDFYDRLVKPRLGALEVDAVDKYAVQSLIDDIGAKSVSSSRHCRAIIRQVLNFGLHREVPGIVRNAAASASVPQEASRERVLTDDELRAIWRAVSDVERAKELEVTLAAGTGLAIMMAMVTLQRGGEVVGIHSRELDREARTWILPPERTKNHRPHVVPLSPLAVSLLDRAYGLQALNDWKGYAFPTRYGKGPILRTAISRVVWTLGAELKIENVRTHDFRRTGSTNITSERIGIPRFIVSRVLNQMSDAGGAAPVTGIYDRNEYLSEKRRALDAWASLLDEIVSGKRRASNVVQLAG